MFALRIHVQKSYVVAEPGKKSRVLLTVRFHNSLDLEWHNGSEDAFQTKAAKGW